MYESRTHSWVLCFSIPLSIYVFRRLNILFSILLPVFLGFQISSTQRPGEVNDSRGSRIPKRSDSIKTPGMERKLPSALRNGQPKKEEEPKVEIWFSSSQGSMVPLY